MVDPSEIPAASGGLDSRALLLDVANARNAAHLAGRWAKRFNDWPADMGELDFMQRVVRMAWRNEFPNDVRTALATFTKDANRTEAAFEYSAPRNSAAIGTVRPNPRLLCLALALGIARCHGAMRVCVNPDCPAPYFLAAKRDQRACERGPCTEWAQRLYKREWWSAHRAEQMAKRGKSKRRKSR